ncbi:hypothetical protein N7492_008696 [Penicillium capsulatum]|uniref:Uncharacterized protein n=1 Tax=Penicillium capsulatum TaxID=69766 RepID=A0A9W9LH70_9EURO|nr:hypothetical protein N7492_008696 [Penicillium capsulatum]
MDQTTEHRRGGKSGDNNMAAAACMGCIKNVTPLHLPNGSKPNARGIAPPLARGGCKIISAPRWIRKFSQRESCPTRGAHSAPAYF